MLQNMKVNFKKNDLVIVISGKDKGKQGKIKEVQLKHSRVVVENINRFMKHVKPTQKNPHGGRELKEQPIHISNIMLVDPKTGKPTRVGRKIIKDAKTGVEKKVRFAKKSGTVLD